MFTPLEALEAIEALLEERYDHPQLERYGELHAGTYSLREIDDIQEILRLVPELR